MSTMNKRSQEALTWRGTVATCIIDTFPDLHCYHNLSSSEDRRRRIKTK